MNEITRGVAVRLALVLLWCPHPLLAQAGGWFSGVWDSSSYNLIEKPKTVALRIELIDKETGLPVKGARVLLKGYWLEEEVGPAAYVPGATTQEREFEMRAVSAGDGVVVFALSWQKDYPWLLGIPVTYNVHSTWKRPVDDIEKVRWIETGHPNFIVARIPFTFDHLTEFGQDKSKQPQDPRLFKEFEEAWHREMKEPGVKFCVLNIGSGFGDFGNTQSTRPEFFDRIKAKDFGRVYLEPMNMTSPDEDRPSVAGPYFVYLLRVELERRPGQIDIGIRPPDEERQRERREEPRRERESVPPSAAPQRGEGRAEKPQPESKEKQPIAGATGEAARDSKAEEKEQQYMEAAQQHPLGIAGETLSPSRRREMGLYVGVKGVLVNYVLPSSPAYKNGLRAGMVIDGIYHGYVSSTSDLDQQLKGKSESVVVYVWRQKGARWERDSFLISLQ